LDAKAAAILARVDPSIEPEAKVQEIHRTLSASHSPSLRDVWDPEKKHFHPIVWIGIILAAFQQLVGINVIFYYGAVLWEAAGFTEQNALLINVISGAINIMSTLVAIAVIDRLGRKPLLVIGSVGMTIFLGILGLVFAGAEVDAGGRLMLSGMAGIIALVSANLYIVFFGISWGPVMWVLLGEMFPNQMRGASLSLAGLSQWCANFAVTMTFPILLVVIGLAGAYGLYAAFALLSIFFAVKFIRETKGKTLEEMTSS
jgi:SP family sugar:H+ symporter-like MFS transporter